MSFVAHAVIRPDGTIRVVGHGQHVDGLHVETAFTVHDGAGFVVVACADDQESADDMARRCAEAEQQRMA